jgi:adenine phosphoribosyltransferase
MSFDFKSVIRAVPDYPKKGILFRDVTTLLSVPEAYGASVAALAAPYAGRKIDGVAGIEARGFIFGGAVALKLATAFVPVRKKGKLPYKTISEEYELEYGTDRIEMHEDAVKKGDKVVLIDDLIATGGTAIAAIKLLERAGAEVVSCAFLVDLPDLGGTEKIRALGKDVVTLVSYAGD